MTPWTNIAERLRERTPALAERWLETTLAAYAPATRAFYRGQTCSFANPAGHGLTTAAARVLEAFVGDGDLGPAAEPLERMMQIRVVTTEEPATAAGFVFALRALALDELERAGWVPSREELDAMHARVDALALMAFDAYAECQRRLHEVRIREISRACAPRQRLTAWSDKRRAAGDAAGAVGEGPSAGAGDR